MAKQDQSEQANKLENNASMMKPIKCVVCERANAVSTKREKECHCCRGMKIEWKLYYWKINLIKCACIFPPNTQLFDCCFFRFVDVAFVYILFKIGAMKSELCISKQRKLLYSYKKRVWCLTEVSSDFVYFFMRFYSQLQPIEWVCLYHSPYVQSFSALAYLVSEQNWQLKIDNDFSPLLNNNKVHFCSGQQRKRERENTPSCERERKKCVQWVRLKVYSFMRRALHVLQPKI